MTASPEYETLLVRERAGRVVVTLHLPESRNAISGRMIAELHQVCASGWRPNPGCCS